MQPVIGLILASGKRRASRSKKRTRSIPNQLGRCSISETSASEMKDFTSARKYYEEALKLEPNGKYAQTAKEALRKLKKK